MGEYHTRRGADGRVDQLCKLGTMDDWRYVRRAEAEDMQPLDAGQGTDIRAALDDPRTLWRFPWPDEDGASLDAIARREMFRTLLFRCADLTCDHQERCVSIHPEGTALGYNVNVWIPCPRTAPQAGLRTSPVAPLFTIYGERYLNGQPRTVFRCAWCGLPFSLGPSDLALVKEALGQETPAAQVPPTLIQRLYPHLQP